MSNKGLEITVDEKVKLQLKTPWSNGTSHLLFTPEEFIEKLCAKPNLEHVEINPDPPQRARYIQHELEFIPKGHTNPEIHL